MSNNIGTINVIINTSVRRRMVLEQTLRARIRSFWLVPKVPFSFSSSSFIHSQIFSGSRRGLWYFRYTYIPSHIPFRSILITSTTQCIFYLDKLLLFAAFSQGMVDDGYEDVVNIDISSVAIQTMRERYSKCPQLKCILCFIMCSFFRWLNTVAILFFLLIVLLWDLKLVGHCVGESFVMC